MRTLLFFHASWCPPCRFYQKQFIEPLQKLVGKDRITAIDAQKDPFTADKYMVARLPSVVLLENDTVVNRITGAIDIEKTAKYLEECD